MRERDSQREREKDVKKLMTQGKKSGLDRNITKSSESREERNRIEIGGKEKERKKKKREEKRLGNGRREKEEYLS